MASVLWVKLIRLGAGSSGLGSLHWVNLTTVTLGPQRGEEYPRSPMGLPCPGSPCFSSNSASVLQEEVPILLPPKGETWEGMLSSF